MLAIIPHASLSELIEINLAFQEILVPIGSTSMDQSNNNKSLLQAFQTLVEIVATLRGPQGCPWDKEQNQKTLVPYVLEEAFELAEAIESEDQNSIKEELGDYLFQVILQAQVAQDEAKFELVDVITSLSQKMVDRHPHVFAEDGAKNIDEVWRNWEKIKAQEKSKSTSDTDSETRQEKPIFSYPKNLPALLASFKIGNKTKRLKFDWNNPNQVFEKVSEELSEVKEELNKENLNLKALEHEIGDLLFSTAQLARHLNLDPEACLREANRRFERRFTHVLKLSKLCLEDFPEMSQEEKEKLWEKSKKLTEPIG